MPSFFSPLLRILKFEGKPRPPKIQKPSLSNFVRTTCVPNWFEKFSDSENGGFYERLDRNFKPIDVGYKRVLTQCRQLYIYVYADSGPGRFLPKLRSRYEFIRDHYYNSATNGWAFSVKDDGSPNDSHLDLYAQSFVILAFSQYARAANNTEAAQFALKTAQLIDEKFRFIGAEGFYEALNADLTPIVKMRRQNPHMHLFEACLFAYDALKDDIYAELAHDIYSLFTRFFFDSKSGTLTEFFQDDLTPHDTEGARIEAGHHFEWVWLLDYYRRLFPEKKDEAFGYMEQLYDWGCRHGYDPLFGGIFDEQQPSGHILKDSKRVWPLCEAIKAHRVMRAYQEKRALEYLEKTKKVFKKRYLRKDTGWNESWNRDFTALTVDYLPGTSVYHL
ncbi:MAG: N-acylglucosamine 2-epimerase [Micavibrio aeruginosavorus]|uniref:N-acylglucosamine 2-epimerase n=1 Tax=Micavibrio aeruginosavorus TaxID=349221 RepID=A0A2W5HUN7_9BACT|nr:MAG: N-acylglucosamine 2-epimerase [Micavibrio aeruginosavorus]